MTFNEDQRSRRAHQVCLTHIIFRELCHTLVPA